MMALPGAEGEAAPWLPPAIAGGLPLAGDWAIAPGEPGQTRPPAAADWLVLDGPQPVAAALAGAGQWSIDGPPRDFDRECWWYRCRFDLPVAAVGAGVTLGFDGLATLARVWLNGEPLFDSRSMFQAWRVQAGERLRAQGNELWMRFDPLADALALRRPRPRWRTPMVAHQQLRWLRTTLLGRTPGWSPPAAVVGPWRPVWWSAADPCRPLALWQQARWAEGTGEFQVACRFAEDAAVEAVRIELHHDGRMHAQPLAPQPDGRWDGTLRLAQAEPWWPHTHGRPALHDARLVIRRQGREAAQPLGRVGFRAVRADTRDGGFGLRVNDTPVFARGVCWTPLDTLRLHAPAARLRDVLTRLRDAGLNLVRIGGTMVYESEDFFRLCDELGLMVWQDLMFASMDYPADDTGFVRQVDDELACQLPAWAAHPSVVVLCGNSEVEQQAAMWGAERASWAPPLFHDHIAQAVRAALPGVVWWPSSAHGGAFPFEPRQGTSAYYGVGAYRRPLDDARVSGLRFATECLAFAQVPPDATLARLRELQGGLPVRPSHPLWKARASRDLGAAWDFDDVRDHYVQALYGEDPAALRQSDPARHLALGRAAVAEVIAAAFDRWRAAGSSCRGALVWFLRDLWAGAGWGLLDDLGNPKAGFHALARVCQPLHWCALDDGLNGITLHGVNDTAQARHGRLELTLWRDGEWPVAQAAREITLAARGAQSFALTEWLPGFLDAGWAYRFGPPPADVLRLAWTDDQGTRAGRVCFIGAAAPRRADIGLTARARVIDDGTVELVVHSRAAARALHLEAEGWQPDDEYLDLAPGEERRLRCTRWPSSAPRPWRASVHAINALAPVAAPLVPARSPDRQDGPGAL